MSATSCPVLCGYFHHTEDCRHVLSGPLWLYPLHRGLWTRVVRSSVVFSITLGSVETCCPVLCGYFHHTGDCGHVLYGPLWLFPSHRRLWTRVVWGSGDCGHVLSGPLRLFPSHRGLWTRAVRGICVLRSRVLLGYLLSE